jgi:alanyl-tRNA synthetase
LNKTERLYYSDSYLTGFRARILEVLEDPRRVVLDRTAFYPTSGGQPFDTGSVAGVTVEDVIDEDDRVVHVLESPIEAGEVEGSVNWSRRFDHMQQHTGQHLLSAVFHEAFGIATVSFHMGATSSTVDLACADLKADQIAEAERRANAVVQENRPVTIAFEDASSAIGLRKPTDRSGPIRIISIEGLDRSACGGTHVRATGEIGPILLRSVDKIRGNVRLEFLCGSRAVWRARADRDALEQIARLFSAPADETPALVAAQFDRAKEADKARRRLEGELASFRGQRLHADMTPDENGVRIVERVLPQGPLPEDLRGEANAFVAGGRAVFIAIEPKAVFLASSADSGIHCGNVLKAVLAQVGGRGGGSAQMAQGSFTGSVEAVVAAVRRSM